MKVMGLDFLRDYMGLLFCDLVIVTVTLLMYFVPKKKINSFIGYRTSSSMKDQSSWDYSQRFYFKNWLFVIPLVVLFQLFNIFLLKSKGFGLIETLSVILFLVYSIVLAIVTEWKLKLHNK